MPNVAPYYHRFPQEGTNNPSHLAGVSDSLSHLSVQQPPAPQITYAPPPAPTPSLPPPPPAYSNTPGPFDTPAAAAWAIAPDDKQRYDTVFQTLNPANGLIAGAAVRPVLERSGLAVDLLRQVVQPHLDVKINPKHTPIS